jgi:dTDP-4-dehydrorhamnose reductase
MDTAKLRLAIEQIGDMSKLQHCNGLWSEGVKDYVTRLAKDGLI